MNGRDRYAVVAGPVPRMGLQRPERFPQGIPVAGLDTEEQAELARRADADARLGRSCCRHCFLLWTCASLAQAARGRHRGLKPDESPHPKQVRSRWMALPVGYPTTVGPEQAQVSQGGEATTGRGG